MVIVSAFACPLKRDKRLGDPHHVRVDITQNRRDRPVLATRFVHRLGQPTEIVVAEPTGRRTRRAFPDRPMIANEFPGGLDDRLMEQGIVGR